MGEGSGGTEGKRVGNAWRMAYALSKAISPKTIRTFVTRKKTASLQLVSAPRHVSTMIHILNLESNPQMPSQLCTRLNDPRSSSQCQSVDDPKV